MDDVAGSAGVGPVFVREVERGKETVQLGRVMKILAELGIVLRVDVPDDVTATLDILKRKGVKPLPTRKRIPAANAGAAAKQGGERGQDPQ